MSCGLVMELPDSVFCVERDRDPTYLASIFDTDFCDYSDLWETDMEDNELVKVADEIYCPVVEDISLDDNELCSAVEKIESE